ncbi:MAG: hypothetical protein JWP35_867 [Caulobacter sp.]|nr:hypothetical protein [Caulobacter sp.]
MLRRAVLSLALALAVAAAAPASSRPHKAVAKTPAAVSPVVVELYTAQGCSSCGKAGAIVETLAARKGVLPLTFAVDYWDYLGWSDTFAKPAFAERQRAYAKRLALREVYTPQVVVDGRAQAAGVHPERVGKLVDEAAALKRDPPQMVFQAGERIAVGSGRAPLGGADVWLVRYDPRVQEVAIKRGDNKGQTFVLRNVVRQLVRLGGWTGRPVSFKSPPAEDDNLSTAIIVQGAKGGRIIGVAVKD